MLRLTLSRYVIAIILIITGVLLILTNLGVLSNLGITDLTFSELWPYLYSIFFVLVGLKMLYDFYKRRSRHWMIGSFLFVFGSLLLLGLFEYIHFTFRDIFNLWPLLIIYVGFTIIGRPKRRKKISIHTTTGPSHTSEKWNLGRLSVGDYEFKEPNWQVEPMELWNLAGDYYIDFTKAFIPEEEIPISIDSLAGDIQILMPENIEFTVEASVKTGEINIFGQKADGINRDMVFTSANYPTATRRLNLSLHLKAGSIRIDRV